MASRAYIGLGSNIGDAAARLSAALADMSRMPDTLLGARSSFYRSAPLEYVAQPDFVNAVVRIETSLTPAALLDALLSIELAHGRTRTFPGAPRTIDLDLLLYGSQCIATERLTVPHPRMHQRAFVLQPLLEIDPEALIPGLGPARGWLSGASGQRVERMG